jgi:Ca2+-binding EF-hand superfamily protein
VSFDVLPLLRKSVPGGDGTRLKERGIKHKWVKLVQTSHVKNNNRRGSTQQRKRSQHQKKTSSASGAAALATSIGVGDDFNMDDEGDFDGLLGNNDMDSDFDDMEGKEGKEGKHGGGSGGGIPIKVHKPAGELCVSVVLVSECEILSDATSHRSSIISTQELLHTSGKNKKHSPQSKQSSPKSGRNSPLSVLGSPSEAMANRRHGVHRGFGDQDFHYAASRLRTIRKELGLKPMELFATIDENRSGQIDRQQFVDMMCRLDLDTTADEASLVFDHFDVDKSGVMDYNEFLQMMMGGEVLTQEIMDKHRMTDEERFQEEWTLKSKMYSEMGIDAVVDRLRMERRKRNLLPQTMFDLFDVDNNGSLSSEELEDALVRMKMPHTGIEVEGMIFLFDHDRDGLLDYSEFLQLVTGGQSKLANDYRLSRKPHPLHEAPHASDEEDEHSSYLVHPPDSIMKSASSTNAHSPRHSGLRRSRSPRRHRKNSISMIQDIVSKVPANDRRLVVELHAATNLPPMDVMGSADPFVLLTVGRKSLKSKVNKASLNPKFQQTFQFGDELMKSSTMSRMFGSKREKNKKGKNTSEEKKNGLLNVEKISIVVKDWNRTGPAQFIGQVDIDLVMMEGQPVGIPVRMSYPLEALKKSRKERLLIQHRGGGADSLGDISRGMIDISLTVLDARVPEEEEESDEEDDTDGDESD